MRIDLPQCDFKDCRRRLDGNCNSKMAYRECKYQQLLNNQTINITRVYPECGDWEALYIDGILTSEDHRLRIDKVIRSLMQFLPIHYVSKEISDDIAEIGMPKYLEELSE